MIFDEGLENVFKRHHRIAEGVRRAVLEGWELKLCAKDQYWYSDTVTAVVVPEDKDAKKVLSTAFSKYHLSLGAGLTKVAGKVFRIGHLGDLNELQASAFISGAEMAMIELVDFNDVQPEGKETKKKKTRRAGKSSTKKATASAAVEGVAVDNEAKNAVEVVENTNEPDSATEGAEATAETVDMNQDSLGESSEKDPNEE